MTCGVITVPTAYSDYMQLVDRVYAVCTEMIFEHVEDTYALYYHSMICNVSYKEFVSCAKKQRPDLLTNIQFTLLPYNLEKVRHAYEKNDSLSRLPFCEMWRRVSLFVNPLVDMILNGEDDEVVWDVTSEVWR